MPNATPPLQVKICGTTSISDALLALSAGADFLGVMVSHPPSPRNVSLEVARSIRDVAPQKTVLLSVNQDIAALARLADAVEPAWLQLHGDESSDLVAALSRRGFRVWKAIHGDAQMLLEQAHRFRDAGAEAVLVDARESSSGGTLYGGTGRVADWNGARALVDAGFRVVLAGGLSPQNVARAIEIVSPFGVDCVSGVEANKGIKDAEKVRDFLREARSKSENAP